MCATCFGHGNYGTANRTAGGKNNTDGHKGVSPSKISPTKTSNTQGTKFNDSSHTNNGQVMTQISAIYAKRSRSILNQFGQSNIGQHAHGAHGTSNPVHINANSNINQEEAQSATHLTTTIAAAITTTILLATTITTMVITLTMQKEVQDLAVSEVSAHNQGKRIT